MGVIAGVSRLCQLPQAEVHTFERQLEVFPSVERVSRADMDTRALWADKMSKGMSLDEAVKTTQSEVGHIWLFTNDIEINYARSAGEVEDRVRRALENSRSS